MFINELDDYCSEGNIEIGVCEIVKGREEIIEAIKKIEDLGFTLDNVNEIKSCTCGDCNPDPDEGDYMVSGSKEVDIDIIIEELTSLRENGIWFRKKAEDTENTE